MRGCGSSVNKVPGSAKYECRGGERCSVEEEIGEGKEMEGGCMVCMYGTHHLCQSLQLQGPCASSPQGKQKACCEEQITIWGNGSCTTETERRIERQTKGEEREEEESRNE